MDDILLARDDIHELDDLKQFLDSHFKIKDLGSVHYFLVLEITSHSQGHLMTQKKFTSEILPEFHCDNFTTVSAPLDHSIKLTTDMGALPTDPSI